MENNEKVRAAEAMKGEQGQKNKLSEQELSQVNGGLSNPFEKLIDIFSGGSSTSVHDWAGSTLNQFCISCGFATPHSPDVNGGYRCNLCGTKYVKPMR